VHKVSYTLLLVVVFWVRKATHHVVSIMWMDIRLQLGLEVPKPPRPPLFLFAIQLHCIPQGNGPHIFAHQLQIILQCILQGLMFHPPHTVPPCML